MTNGYFPRKIIRNYINEFAPLRGMKIENYMLDKKVNIDYSDDDKLNSLMLQFGNIRVDATIKPARGKRDWVVAVFIDPTGEMMSKAAKIKNLVESIQNEQAFLDGRLYELNLIVDSSFMNKFALMAAYSSNIASIGPDKEGTSPFYNLYPFNIFCMNILENSSVGKYRIVDDDEISLLNIGFSNKADLAVINSNDPPVIWVGGRDDQIVEIIYDSETCGIATAYRRIEKAVF